MNISDAESLFELSGDYTLADVRAAYKRLALKYHPDQNDNSQAANFFMGQINEAREILEASVGDGSSYAADDKRQYQEHNYEAERRQRETEERTRKQAEEADRKRRASEEARRQRETAEAGRRYQAEQEKRRAEAAAKKQREKAEREQEYLRACEKAQQAKTAKEHADVAGMFQHLGAYRDSSSFYEYHKRIADEKKVVEQKEAAEKAKKQGKRDRTINTISALSLIAPPVFGIATLLNNESSSASTLALVLFVVPILCGIWCLVKMDHKTASDAGIAVSIFGIATMGFSAAIPEMRYFLVLVIAQLFGAISCDCGFNKNGKSTGKSVTAIMAFTLFAASIAMYFSS